MRKLLKMSLTKIHKKPTEITKFEYARCRNMSRANAALNINATYRTGHKFYYFQMGIHWKNDNQNKIE